MFVSRLLTSIETRNVWFLTFVFSVKGMISVILILVVAVYQQILSNTEQGFIGLLTRVVGHAISNLALGVGQSFFVPKGGGGSCVFYRPHFQMLRPTPPPPILFDQSLRPKLMDTNVYYMVF